MGTPSGKTAGATPPCHRKSRPQTSPPGQCPGTATTDCPNRLHIGSYMHSAKNDVIIVKGVIVLGEARAEADCLAQRHVVEHPVQPAGPGAGQRDTRRIRLHRGAHAHGVIGTDTASAEADTPHRAPQIRARRCFWDEPILHVCSLFTEPMSSLYPTTCVCQG